MFHSCVVRKNDLLQVAKGGHHECDGAYELTGDWNGDKRLCDAIPGVILHTMGA